MTLIQLYLKRLICLCTIIGNHYFATAQSDSKSKNVNYQFAQNKEFNKSLREALFDLGKKFNVSFVYPDKIADDKAVNSNSYNRNGSLDENLSDLLKDFNLSYRKISDKQIAIIEAVSQKAEKKEYAKTIVIEGYTQQIKQDVIKGRVTTNKDNSPLAGATISVKGKRRSVVSDNDGNFQINANDGDVLVVEYVNYEPREITVSGQSSVAVALTEKETLLGEVVVTALGIKKEARKLGYATANVTRDQVTVNRTTNFMNALEGKVPGVNITSLGTGPAGTSKIRIRGQSSFGAQNSPLIVMNGVPIDNTTFGVGGPIGTRGVGNSDGGDGLSSINQDDIESMTVLKGGAAAALYGARAKDGVIMITTKSQGGNGIGVEYNTNFTTETPLDYTDYQYEYGQGEFGVRPTTPNPTSGVWSFGEKFAPGLTQVLFDGVEVPYVPVRNRIRKFYRTGTSWTNTVTLSSGNEKGGFNLSASNLASLSIVPNSNYKRKNINLGFTQNITKQLTVSGNINYSNEVNKNPVQIAGQDISTPVVIYTLSNSMPLDLLNQKRYDENGNEFVYSRFRNRTNPYISIYDHFENIRRDRLYGNITARYSLTDWMYVQARLGQDYYSRDRDYNDPTGRASNAPAPAGFVNGTYTQEVRRFREVNSDFLLGATRKFGNIGVDITAGGNARYVRSDLNNTQVTDFIVRGLYTVMNGRVKDPIYDLQEKKVNSLYGATELSYKTFLYLNVTARNDWFSTLSPANRSILYPSVTGSFIFTDAFQRFPAWLSFGKIRAGYSEVGSDLDVAPYSNNLFYGVSNNLFPNPGNNTQPVAFISGSTIPNNNLRPMRVSEAEVGLELKMFNNRVGLDLTFYNKISKDQILAAQVSDASGYASQLINVGKSRNTGLEALLTLSPVKTANFKWDVSFNGAYNTSEVLDLGKGVKEIQVAGSAPQAIRQVVGKPLGQLFVFPYLRDAKGNQVFDNNNGRPLRADAPISFGSAIPKYFGGVFNSINYRGIILSALIDYKLGHVLSSQTNFNLWRHGLAKETLNGREQGYVIGEGVSQGGGKNTIQTPLQTYYETVNTSGIRESFIYKAGFWKLRQITLSYDLTRLASKITFIKGLRLSAVANNVLMIKKWVPNIDPEQNGNTSDNEVGLEATGLPTARSIGLNLNVKF